MILIKFNDQKDYRELLDQKKSVLKLNLSENSRKYFCKSYWARSVKIKT